MKVILKNGSPNFKINIRVTWRIGYQQYHQNCISKDLMILLRKISKAIKFYFDYAASE